MRISDWSSDVCSSDLELQRVVLESQGRAVEQLHQPGALVELLQRGDGCMLEAGIGLGQDTPEVAVGDAAGNEGTNHGESDLGIGPAGEAADFPRGERSEEHTSELQSLMRISYAVFCLKKKKR